MTDDVPVVAVGGATVWRGMKLHKRGCPCLGMAVEVREARDSEINSREWCKRCSGEFDHKSVEQTKSAYRSLKNASASDIGDAE